MRRGCGGLGVALLDGRQDLRNVAHGWKVRSWGWVSNDRILARPTRNGLVPSHQAPDAVTRDRGRCRWRGSPGEGDGRRGDRQFRLRVCRPPAPLLNVVGLSEGSQWLATDCGGQSRTPVDGADKPLDADVITALRDMESDELFLEPVRLRFQRLDHGR